MVEFVNECLHCDDYCMDCGLKKRKIILCDNCGDEINDTYLVDGDVLCSDCCLDVCQISLF